LTDYSELLISSKYDGDGNTILQSSDHDRVLQNTSQIGTAPTPVYLNISLATQME
jgi:hypothetical protein